MYRSLMLKKSLKYYDRTCSLVRRFLGPGVNYEILHAHHLFVCFSFGISFFISWFEEFYLNTLVGGQNNN